MCEPARDPHGRSNALGLLVIETDPAVEVAGIDTGFVLGPRTMRAPGISVRRGPAESGFVHGAPLLAIEMVAAERDEEDLQRKVRELLDAGTKLVRVVRVGRERRVEVHRRGRRARVVRSGDELAAPGILRNRVPVDAFYDRRVAHRIALRNLKQRLER